jgi:hypothetical protein
MTDDTRADIETAIRQCADLADVQRAVAIAAKLSAEKLEEIVSNFSSPRVRRLRPRCGG